MGKGRDDASVCFQIEPELAGCELDAGASDLVVACVRADGKVNGASPWGGVASRERQAGPDFALGNEEAVPTSGRAHEVVESHSVRVRCEAGDVLDVLQRSGAVERVNLDPRVGGIQEIERDEAQVVELRATLGSGRNEWPGLAHAESVEHLLDEGGGQGRPPNVRVEVRLEGRLAVGSEVRREPECERTLRLHGKEDVFDEEQAPQKGAAVALEDTSERAARCKRAYQAFPVVRWLRQQAQTARRTTCRRRRDDRELERRVVIGDVGGEPTRWPAGGDQRIEHPLYAGDRPAENRGGELRELLAPETIVVDVAVSHDTSSFRAVKTSLAVNVR